jgi:pimeloyl-ACP methyl ester carboxylesterase
MERIDPATVDGCVVHRHGSGRPIVCVPAFADTAQSWAPLVAELSDRFEVAVLDLPGFGRAAPQPTASTVTGIADLIAAVVRRTWSAEVVLVAHSIGSAFAVRAGHQLGNRCRAVVSIEGNLTADDAYLTGQAADFDDPAEFKHHLSRLVDQLVAAGKAPASYAASVRVADAETMWALGRDAARQGTDDRFGHELLRLPCPVTYLWSASTTPPASQRFLHAHPVPHQRLPIPHHWPWTIDAPVVAQAITACTGVR